MTEFIHSPLAQNEAVVAGTTISYDLPVNPLSHIFVTFLFAQNQPNTQLAQANIALMISRLEILYRGSAIVNLNGADIIALQSYLFGYEPMVSNANGDDNDLRYFTFLIPMTRNLYSPKECYPRSNRGELIMNITYPAAFTQIDGVSVQIETVELPDASPSRYMRTTTLTTTPTAAGEMDIQLPIGNKIAAVLFFGTTIPAANVATKTLEYGQLLIDNQRRYYSQINFETWRQIAALRSRPPIAHACHFHQVDAAAFAQYMDTSHVKYAEDASAQYVLWDFDPTNDDLYLLETAGHSDIVARIYAGDTSAIRVMPIELIGV